jgi:hypothetical protein
MAIIKGKATTLKLTITGTPTLIPYITKLKTPAYKNETMDITNLDSTVVERDDTLPDPGELTGELNYDSANAVHQALQTLAASGGDGVYTVTLPNNATIGFTGIITNWEPGEVDAKGKHTRSFSIQPVGSLSLG